MKNQVVLESHRRTRFGVRELAYVAVFGALWGGLEMTLGAYLHVIRLPFTGVIMAGVGLPIALVGRRFVPQRGSVLMIGLVTALLKMLSVGGVVLNPMIAILAQSLLAELALLAVGRPRRLAYVLAGALGVSWNVVHPFLTQGLLSGWGIVRVYEWTIERGARLLGLEPSAALVILGGLLVVHFATGALAGWLAWNVGDRVWDRVRE